MEKKPRGGRERCLVCRSHVGDNVTLFQFPQDEQRRREWAAFCGIDLGCLKPSYRLCSRHFSESMFKRSLNNRRCHLKPTATPTVIDTAMPTDSQPSRPKYRKHPEKVERKLPWCTICGNVDARLHTFCFPKDPNVLILWLNACELDRDDLRECDRLCEAHFEAADVVIHPKKARLKKGALPSKFLPPKESADQVISGDGGLPKMEDSNDFDDNASCMKVELQEGAGHTTLFLLASCVDGNVSDRAGPSSLLSPIENDPLLMSDDHGFPSEGFHHTQFNGPHNGFGMDVESNGNRIVEEVDSKTPLLQIVNAGSHCSPTSTCKKQVTPSLNNDPRTPAVTRFPRHIDQINTPDCGRSQRAKIILDVARRDIMAVRTRNEKLRKQNFRLQKKVETLTHALEELRSKNLLNEEAMRSIKVRSR